MTELIIKTLATGSTGNAYHLKYGDDELLVEAGIPLKKIKEGLNFKLSRVSGCLCSHMHLDHAKAVKDIVKAGIDCFMSKETAEAINVSGHRVHHINHHEQFSAGAWQIVPFATEHDCEGCLGFLIAIGDVKILFATDTAFLSNRFKGLSHIMIECNYSEGLIVKNVQDKELHYAQMKRTLMTHFGLQNVVGFLKETDMAKVKEVILIHLSSANADEKLIREVVEQTVGGQILVTIP